MCPGVIFCFLIYIFKPSHVRDYLFSIYFPVLLIPFIKQVLVTGMVFFMKGSSNPLAHEENFK